jgi:hypothetical protein
MYQQTQTEILIPICKDVVADEMGGSCSTNGGEEERL